MVLQSSGPIKFSNLKTEFNGAAKINFSDYYRDATTYYTFNMLDIPLKIVNSINLSNFYGKKRYTVIAYVTGSTIPYSAITTTNPVMIINYNVLGYTITFINYPQYYALLLVGGGAGGGYSSGGGGAGGQVYFNNNAYLTDLTYKITIGKGGIGSQNASTPATGGDGTYIYNINNITKFYAAGISGIGRNGSEYIGTQYYGGNGGSGSRSDDIIDGFVNGYPSLIQASYFIGSAAYKDQFSQNYGGGGSGAYGSSSSGSSNPGAGYQNSITGNLISYGMGGYGGKFSGFISQSTIPGSGGNGGNYTTPGKSGQNGVMIITNTTYAPI